MSIQTADARYIFAASPVPTLPIKGPDKLFPWHRITCVVRNDAEHAIEMGHDPNREAPFFFQKNPDTLVQNDGTFPYPDASKDVHHELEMVVALKSGGKNIAVDAALS